MKKFTYALLLPALLASSAAFAGGDGNTGAYAGLDIGQGKPGVAAVAGNTVSKSSGTVVGGTVGYKINTHLAAEGQYTGVGKVSTAAGGSAKGDALAVSAVGIAPLNDKFGLYGKLGYARTKTTTSGFGANGTSRTAPTVGVGAQYNVTDKLGVRVGVDRFGAATADAVTGAKTKANANVTSVGAVFSF